MSRVAIVGSCITRDLWPVRGDGAADLLYVSRTSLASLFAPPVAGFRPPAERPEALGRHQQLAVADDLAKTALGRLVAFRPTHLILDFIDERFDLMAVGESIVTRSWELEASGYLDDPAFAGARTIPRLSVEAEGLWAAGAAEFAALIRATPLAETALVLHAAQWATTSRPAAGETGGDLLTLAGGADHVARQNDLLARYERRIAAALPMVRVEAPAARIADEGHRWGFSPFHYVPEYYAAIWDQLAALGITRAA